LQINLLAEREVTRLLQMTDRIAGHIGVEAEPADAQLKELSEVTKVDKLMARSTTSYRRSRRDAPFARFRALGRATQDGRNSRPPL
jgi:hypothetical protein